MPVRESRVREIGSLDAKAVSEIGKCLHALLADVYALYMKTKNFHWHMRGPHFRDYHLLLDEHAAQIYAISDAERARKIGATTVRSIGDISRSQRLKDNDAPNLTAADMLRELHEDNPHLVAFFRDAHELCADHGDVATTSLIETWIDEAERRAWFLRETLDA